MEGYTRGHVARSAHIAGEPRRRLLIFAKQPIPGVAKTRLATGIGVDAAISLYRSFLVDVANRARHLLVAVNVEICWVHTPSDPSFADVLMQLGVSDVDAFRFVGYDHADLTGQQDEQLRAARACGVDHVVIVGADTPHVPTRVLVDAFTLLESKDIVIGPAVDGGYYLAGFRAGWDLLRELDMRSPTVRDDLVRQAVRQGFTCGYVESATDIDTAADIDALSGQTTVSTAACPATIGTLRALGLWS